MRPSPRRLALALAAATLAACGTQAPPPEQARTHAPFLPPELADRGGRTFSFVNGDFETGDTSGWTVSIYRNNGLSAASPTTRAQLNLQAPTTGITNRTSVKTAPAETLQAAGVASTATLKIPKYGTHAVVVNELGDGRNVNAIKQSMTVTNADVDPNDGKVHVRFALAPVLENPGHTAVQQPYFWATLTNVTKANAVLFYTFNYANQAGVPWKSTTDPADGEAVLYTDWQSFDISPGPAQLAVGDTVELEIIAAGCSQSGHYGHVYLDGIGAYLPGLAVAATAPASVNTGATLTYTFRYSNNGIDAAPSTVVSAVLPTGTTFASLNAPGATCTAPAAGATGTVSCNVGTVNPASTGTFTVTVNVTAASGSTISNGNYSVSATGVSALLGPLVTTGVTAGTTYVDLAATASDGVAAVNWGSTTTYTVVVRNNGPSAANGAAIAVPVPARLTGFSAWACTASGGAACGAAGGSGAIATTANLPSGGQVSYVITAPVASGTGASSISLQATATAPAGTTDSTPSNNVAVDFDDVGTLRTLTASKTGAGVGTILSSPTAIACGTSCTSRAAVFLDGASVVLTASTAAGNRFVGWSTGPCAGSSTPSCAVTVSSDLTVTADFLAGDWLVSGSALTGNGTVACQSPRLDGQSSACTITPAARHRLTALTDDGADVLGAVAGGTYTIASVTTDHTVVGTFTANTAATSLAASPAASAALGAPVTFTATVGGVAPTGTPGGTVDFLDGATPLCTAVPVVGGQATCSTSALALGTHLVTAASGGDATWPGASSPALSFDVTAGAATLGVSAGAGPYTYGQAVTLTTTASGPAGHATPTGTVTFRVNGMAVPGCTGVLLVGGIAACTIPTLPAGSPVVTVDYDGDVNYLPAEAAATATVTVDKATATVTLASLSQVYTGTPRPASATTTPAGLTVAFTYDGAATAPTNVGTYAVVGTISDASYQGSTSGTLEITKAAATVTLASLSQVYTGAPRPASATTTPAGLTVTFTYDGAATAPTNAGTYAVVGTISDANYQGSASGTLEITKAAASITVTGLTTAFDGNPEPVTVTTAPAGLAYTVTYDGSATAPTNAGTYTVVVTVTDPNYAGTVTQTLTITKATATVTLGGLSQVYTGTPRAATAITTPAGLTVAFTYDGAATAPTNVGTYAVVGTIVDANYQGSASGTLEITKATATVTLGSLSQVYTGAPRAASATSAPAGLSVTFTYDGAATAPTNAGTYAVVGTISDANYQGSASGTLEITKAAATLDLAALGNLSQVYDGTPRPVTATTTPAGLPVTFTYDGSPTPPTGAGSYTVVATVNDPNYQGTLTATLVVAKANATVTLGGLSQAYTGAPRTATYGATPGVAGFTVTYAGSPTPPTNPGSYAVVVTVNDPNYQGSATGTLVITAAAPTVTLASAANPSAWLQQVTFTATVSGSGVAPTGSVTFLDGATVLCGGPVVLGGAGTATCATSALAVGAHAVTAAYSGDANYAAASGGLTQQVDAAATTTTLAASSFTPIYGQALTLTATVAAQAPGGGTPAGTVTFSEGATTWCTSVLIGTTATCALPATLATGDHTFSAAFGGSTQHLASTSASLTRTVTKASAVAAVTTSGSPSAYGSPVTFRASVTGPAGVPTGSVTFTDGAATLCPAVALDAAGVATCGSAALVAGNHIVTATYGGDANHGSALASVVQFVDTAVPGVAAAAAPDPATYGATVTLSATVTGPGAVPTGSVDFTEGGTRICLATLDGAGVARCTTTTLGAGPHALSAQYGGDLNHQGAGATFGVTVQQAPVTVLLASSANPATYASTATFTATVSGAGATPAGTVTFLDGATVLCGGARPLTAGVATCALGGAAGLAGGPHTLTARYDGSANYLTGTSAPLVQQIDLATPGLTLATSGSPTTFGAPVTFTATLSGAGLTPTGAVTFSAGAATLCGAVTATAGVATCTTSALPRGLNDVVATFGGDGNYAGATAHRSQTVTEATPTISLQLSPSPSAFGEPVAILVTVTGPGPIPPGGTVEITEGVTPLCGGPLPLTGGVATCVKSDFSAADHLVVAAYPGDANYLAAAPAARLHTVQRAPTAVALAASPATAVHGEPVVLTATVTALPPGAGLPGGQVDFYDGATVIGSATVDPATGVATYTVTAAQPLSAGSHDLMATYGGDASFTGSVSDTLPAYLVGQASTLVTVTSSSAPSVFGEAVTFTVTVSPVAPGGGVPGGAVTVQVGTAAPFDLPLVAGANDFTISTLAVGDHALSVTYPGDPDFLPSSGGMIQTVGQAGTAVSGAASPAPSVYGELVTLTATVTAVAPGAGVPAGTVRFLLGGAELGRASLDASGRAALGLATLPAGPSTIDLAYDGEARFTASQGTLPHLVLQAATTAALTVAPAGLAVYGEPVLLEAAITPAFFGAGAPTGQVAFLDGATLLGTATLDGFGRASLAPAGLAPGPHAFSVSYAGDGGFLDASDGPLPLLVRPAAVTVSLSAGPNPSVSGEAVAWTIQAQVASPSLAAIQGSVELLDGADLLATVPLDATGAASGSTAALAVGSHLLTARYVDEPRFAGVSTASLTQQVARAATSVTLDATPSPSTLGARVSFTARVSVRTPGTGTPAGLVTFSDGAAVLGTVALDAAGLARLDVDGLTTGLHQVVASYQGDVSFEPRASTPFLHPVTPAGTTSTTTVAPSPARFGQAVRFTTTVATSSGVPTGLVEFRENGAVLLGAAPVDGTGQASFSTAALGVGSHVVVASYVGDADHAGSTAAAVTAVVQAAATTTALEVTPLAGVAGQPVTLTATVLPVAPGAGAPSGRVTFLDGATVLGSATLDLATQRATLDLPSLAVGSHALSAAYPGDGSFLASSGAAGAALVVDQASVTVAVTASPAASVVGQPVTVTAVVTPVAPGAGAPTGLVVFTDGATRVGEATLVAGRAELTVTPAAGEHTLVASYQGDAAFKAGAGDRALTTGRAATATTLATSGSPSTAGQPVTLTASVVVLAPGAGTASGLVTFKDGATVLGTAALGAGGTATFTATLPEGLRTLAAEYGGDASFAPSSGSASQAVQAAGVAVAVSATPSPADFGQVVTVTASVTSTVAGTGTPGGTVQLLDGSTLVATATLDASGHATFDVPDLAAGLHQLTVTFPGGGGFGAGRTSIALEVRQVAATLALASSRNPTRAGRPVTFTATVSAGAVALGGTVTFKDGPLVIGTAPVVDGVATFTTRSLRRGTHAISAQLPGTAGTSAASGTLAGGQVVENSAPVAGSGSALRLGPGHALRATAAAGGALDEALATVEVWARAGWTTPDQAGATPTLVRLGDAAAARWALGVTPDRTRVTLTLGTTTTAVPADLSDGAWHQVALSTVDGVVTVLLDGVEVGAVDGALGAAAGERLSLGEGFTGEVDELRVWSAGRAAAAVAADARRPLQGTEPWLLACWRLDEAEGAEAFDAGPAGLDLAVELDPAVQDATAFGPSGAWRRRVVGRERPLSPIDAGYDADGDRLALTITTPPAHGGATTDGIGLQVGYQGADGFSGQDGLAFRLTDTQGASSDYAVDITVERLLACDADADCSGGDVCAQHVCVAPGDLAARAGGCGCTSGGGGALALWSLLALGLLGRRRPRRAQAGEGRVP